MCASECAAAAAAIFFFFLLSYFLSSLFQQLLMAHFRLSKILCWRRGCGITARTKVCGRGRKSNRRNSQPFQHLLMHLHEHRGAHINNDYNNIDTKNRAPTRERESERMSEIEKNKRAAE